MKLRIIPYRLGSSGARLLAEKLSEKLGYKVWRGDPKGRACNISWGNKDLALDANWINHPLHVMVAANKLDTFNLLFARGVSHVPYTASKTDAQAWLEKGHTVFARTATGQAGSGITVVKPGEELPTKPLYTQYVKKKKEFRVHVFNGKAILVQEKRKKNGVEANPLVRSHHNGWVFCLKDINEPDGLRVLGVDAVNALGLDFGAVDIIYNEHQNKCYVLEINTAPGLCTATVEAYSDAICSSL